MKPAAIVNPYAKKPPPAASSTTTTSGNHSRSCQYGTSSSSSSQQQTTRHDARPPSSSSRLLSPPTVAAASAASSTDLLAGKRIVHAASFSQAFESIAPNRSTTTNSSSSNTNNNSQQQPQDGNRAAQDNIDAAHQNAASMTDRESHVLLQQPHVLYVSTKQRGNGLLQYIRNVPYAYARMVPDYVLSPTQCALFLSFKYHSLYPNYIHRRIAELKQDFNLRILLCLVDVQDNAHILRFLNKLAVTHNLTLMLAWSEEEAARYLETYKAFYGRDATLIQRKESTHFADQVADFLGACTYHHRTVVNKTDAAMLLSQFNSVRSMTAASMDELALVSGMGQVKVQRLHDALHRPFSKRRAKQRKKQQQQQQQQREEEADALDSVSPGAPIANDNAKDDDSAIGQAILDETSGTSEAGKDQR
jgi:DNA excision repair protein ERCC-1